jgi:dihydrofolate reductase
VGRLIVIGQTTVDGIMDQKEGWFDERLDGEAHGVEELRAADALLLGRATYELLSTFWPEAPGPYAELMNTLPKYVASRTLTGPLTWNAQLLGPDTAEVVAALKAKHAEVILYGCGELGSFLARHGLVDEVRLWLYPAIWGDGLRAFQAGELPMRLRLVTARPYSTGVVQLVYQPLTT